MKGKFEERQKIQIMQYIDLLITQEIVHGSGQHPGIISSRMKDLSKTNCEKKTDTFTLSICFDCSI